MLAMPMDVWIFGARIGLDARRARVLSAARGSCVRSVHGGTQCRTAVTSVAHDNSDGCLVCSIVDIGIDATTLSQLCVF